MVIFIPEPVNCVVHKSAVIVVFSFDATNLYESAPAFTPLIVNWASALYGFDVGDVYGLPSVILTLNVFIVSDNSSLFYYPYPNINHENWP